MCGNVAVAARDRSQCNEHRGRHLAQEDGLAAFRDAGPVYEGLELLARDGGQKQGFVGVELQIDLLGSPAAFFKQQHLKCRIDRRLLDEHFDALGDLADGLAGPRRPPAYDGCAHGFLLLRLWLVVGHGHISLDLDAHKSSGVRQISLPRINSRQSEYTVSTGVCHLDFRLLTMGRVG
ncbi:MAG TPA: hypothetical protein ENH80_12820 [Phycisphaerae bacterium]|nr:hypothetical protein [Phycisphaerae bacterium]HDZ44809.1 hypothetical protein [Phycisphaerae bacterium]